MADCRKHLLLAAYHDDELGASERAAVEEHLRTCEACRAELDALRSTSNPLRRLREERLDHAAMEAIHQRFHEEAVDDSRFMRFAMTLGVIAASVLLVGVAWLKVLPASSGAVKPVGPVVVSPREMQPWEQTAITLRPDPSTLPTDSDEPKNDLATAERILHGLEPRSGR